MATKVITPLARISYPHLDTPQKAQNADEKDKYGATFLFDEGTDLTALQAAVIEAAEERWGSKAKEMFRTGALKSPFRKDAEAKGYPAGTVFINTRSEQQPGTVYPYAEPGSNPPKPAKVPQDKIKQTFYPGAYVYASVRAFPYDKKGNKGVAFALNNVQFVRDGDRLDNRVAAEDEFTVELTTAPAELLDSLL